jgi:primase-polymerase (primpol)-like protein
MESIPPTCPQTQGSEDSSAHVFPAFAELAEKTQWVVYCLEPDKTDPTRLTKVPYNARTGYKASSTNPKQWSTYAQACKAWKNARNVNGNPFDGIGFVFNGGISRISK